MKYILSMGLKDSYNLFWCLSIRYYHNCIQHQLSLLSKQKNRKCKYYWAIIKYNFKSDIIFYDVLSNKNGKFMLQIYINFIFEPIVKFWIMAREDFVLEEKGDLGYDLSKKNPIYI